MTLNPAMGVYALLFGVIWSLYIGLRTATRTPRSAANRCVVRIPQCAALLQGSRIVVV